MKKKLKEELRKLSTDIITSRNMNDISELYEASKTLYEKLAVLKFIDEKLSDIQVDVSKNVIAAKFEELANAVLNENSSVPESNPHTDDIVNHKGMATIKDMVSEMPSDTPVDEVLSDFLGKPELMKNDKEIFEPKAEDVATKPKPRSLNDKLKKKEINVGLNDRIAFVKHLFNGNAEDYKRVLSQLATIESEERSMAFINNMVKPEYNNWEGKEEYEERFIALIEHKFA